MAHEGKAGVEGVVALRVLVDLGGHAADDREVVGKPGQLGEKVRHHHAALAARLRLPRAGHDVPVVVEHRGLHRHGHRLAVALRQRRLGIERVHMRHAAAHVGEYDALGPRREVRRTHRQARAERAAVHQARQRERTEAERRAAECFAAGQGTV